MSRHTRIFLIEPVPASRPRVSRYGTYYLPTYRNFKTDFNVLLREEAVPKHQGMLKVRIECVVRKPKTTARGHPIGDVDNYAKAVLDCLNGHMWEDDDQIVDLRVTKKYGEEGYIVVEVENVKSDGKTKVPKVRSVRKRSKR